MTMSQETAVSIQPQTPIPTSTSSAGNKKENIFFLKQDTEENSHCEYQITARQVFDYRVEN